MLAAWSAQNPRLLLNSATDKHANGLGNASGLVGRFMMSHHVASTWGMFDEDVQNHMGTIAVQYMSYERYAKTSHPGAFGSSFITAGFALKTTDLANSRADLFGPELADYMKRAARGLAGHQDLRRRTAEHGKPRRTRQAKRTSSACRSAS